ncbi:MAG: hypothetical protein KDC35_06270 [Acidobacteria bacterium]|nr:hypothetical protein [Acidobacteriota bacterium]
MSEIKQISVGSYSHFDQDAKVIMDRICLFALAEDGSVWMMKDPSGDESSEYWTPLPPLP